MPLTPITTTPAQLIQGGALFRCLRGPCWHRFRRRRHCLLDLSAPEKWDRSNDHTIGRIADLKFSGSIDPFTAYQTPLFKQFGSL